MAVFHVVFLWHLITSVISLVFHLATGAFLVSRIDRLHVESGGPLSVQRDIQFMYLIRPSLQHSPIALWARYITHPSQQVFVERGAFHPVGKRIASFHTLATLSKQTLACPTLAYLATILCDLESPECKAMRLGLRITGILPNSCPLVWTTRWLYRDRSCFKAWLTVRAFILMARLFPTMVLVTTASVPWATNLFIPKGHARYCSPFRGPHAEK